MYKRAFTLAEVLITLGIIGIVAAMTLPTLIQKHNNNVVETRLKKFYSAINQAIMMAEADYGDKKYWYADLTGADFDADGNPIAGSSDIEKWCNKFFIPYLNVIKTETLSDGTFLMYFEDGSAFRPANSSFSRDWLFYSGNVKKCIDMGKTGMGVCAFYFFFFPTSNGSCCKYHYNKGMEPYKYAWDGNISTLYTGTYGCSTNSYHPYCTAIIQMNGWKIPDDYPFKVRY